MNMGHLISLCVTVLFILFPSFLQFVSPDTSATYLLHICENRFNYSQNSLFQDNLNHLISNLSSEISSINFYNSSFGEDIDKAYGFLFCPAYIAPQDCHTCIQSASKLITQECPNQKGAVIYYLECVLRYENNFFSPNKDANLSVYWKSPTQVYNPDQFNQVLENKMDGLITKAAFGSSAPTFAEGEGDVSASQQLYCFAQCTPDINGSTCDVCLRTKLSFLHSNCYGAEWALMYGPKCQMRYSLAPFYGVGSSSSLPPAGSAINPVSTSPAQETSGKKKHVHATLITMVILAAVLVVLFVLISTYFITRKNRTRRKVSENEELTPSMESLQFHFGTIKAATNSFSHANKLGEGGFGPVYKGLLLNGQEIAVKKLSGSSKQGQEQFKNEVLLLARLRHKHLVRLLGFCLEGQEKLVVYEFLPNKSLDYFIFDPVKRAQLDWKSRYNIIQGIARGLLHLHEGSHDRIIHRDLKPSNILLDAAMEPKISDFGTARLVLLDQSHHTASKIMGTLGYMPPEYAKQGYFSIKSDVYGFGVLVLEILSGQRIFCFHNTNNGDNLLSYAWKNWKKNTALDIVDPTMAGPKIEIIRCIHIGLLCVQENAADRPTMDLVVNMLTSSSFSLSQPSRPAFFVPERLNRTNVSRTFDSVSIKSDMSKIESAQWSVNDYSITDVEAR